MLTRCDSGDCITPHSGYIRAACDSGTIRQNTWPPTMQELCTHARSSAAGTRTGRAILDGPCMSMTTSSGPPKLPWNKHAGLQGGRHPHKTSASDGRLHPWGRPARGRASVAPSSDCDGCCIPAPCCHEMLSTQFGLSAGKNAKKNWVPGTSRRPPGRPRDPRDHRENFTNLTL